MLVATGGDEKPYRPKFTRKKLPTIADYVRDQHALFRLQDVAENVENWIKLVAGCTGEVSPVTKEILKDNTERLALMDSIIKAERLRLIEMLREIKRGQA